MIRPLALQDHDAWLSLWRGYQGFYEVSIADEVSQITWTRLLDPAEPVWGALALDDEGNPIGLVHWILHRSTWTVGDYCYLQDLFVAAAVRGRGTGAALIEHVSAAARQAGCSRLYWLTHKTNTAAMRLYDKVSAQSGFLQYRTIL